LRRDEFDFQGLIEDMAVPFPIHLAITNTVILDVR